MIQFEDPPERRSRRQLKWWPLIEPLREAPGRWARIARLGDAYQAQNAVRSLRTRKVRYPDGCYEFRADGAKVYARYIQEDT